VSKNLGKNLNSLFREALAQTRLKSDNVKSNNKNYLSRRIQAKHLRDCPCSRPVSLMNKPHNFEYDAISLRIPGSHTFK